MILDGMALWGVQGLKRADVIARISAVPEMIAALQAVLDANPDDDEAMMEVADKINYALSKAGV